MRKILVIRVNNDGNDGNNKTCKAYNSITDAARDVGGQASHISECMRGIDGRKRHKGYRWEGSRI